MTGSAFGLQLHAPFALPELERSSGIGVPVDVSVETGEVRVGWHERTYGHALGVAVTGDANAIKLTVCADQPELQRVLTLGVGLTMVLEARGHSVIHGNTVCLGDRAIVLCGPSGVGKSSVTAAMLAAGATLVADDLCVVEHGYVRPGFGRLKLWKDTAEHFGLPVDEEHRIHPDHAKYSVPVPLVDTPVRLGAFVVLERGEAAPERLSGSEAVMAMLANHRLPEIADRARYLRTVSELVQTVDVWRVRLPGDLDALEGAVDAWMRASGYAGPS